MSHVLGMIKDNESLVSLSPLESYRNINHKKSAYNELFGKLECGWDTKISDARRILAVDIKQYLESVF